MKYGLFICPKCNSTTQIEMEDKDKPELLTEIHCIKCSHKGLSFIRLNDWLSMGQQNSSPH